jgi:DNA-binding MarR family transcriptional regulator
MLRNADDSHRAKAKQHTPSGEAFARVILEAVRFNGCLLAAGDRLTQDLGLTSARWQVLGAIDEGPLPVAQISRNMGLSRQAVQRVANELAAGGFVAFADNPNHRRAKLVELTEIGRRRSTRSPNGRRRGPIASQPASTHRCWTRRQMFF